MVKRALLSVYDKEGIVELGRGLASLGAELVSSGGTARHLREAGLEVRDVSEITGLEEIMGGRVKTLHPVVHGGILARRDAAGDLEDAERLGIPLIDMVVVNLYPFERVVAGGPPEAEALENIDIGGPALIRAAAKNFPHVLVLTSPEQYGPVLEELRKGEVSLERRRQLAREAFALTAAYDAAIMSYLGEGDVFPAVLVERYDKVRDLRYGENPHQRAAFYSKYVPGRAGGLAGARLWQGKPLSYNNLADAHAAYAAVSEFPGPTAVAVKHANPCGVATRPTLAEAFAVARDADPVSIFGGIVALNQRVDEDTARLLANLFLEVVIAPGYSPAALEVLAGRENFRVLEMPLLRPEGREVRSVAGGLLVQSTDDSTVPFERWDLVIGQVPSQEIREDLEFANRVVKHVKSNAVVVAAGLRTLGIGAGQMNRLDAARIALSKAQGAARGAVLASDGFLPFPDVVEEAAKAGIRAIVQPGGSVRDRESVEAARAHGITMFFTGRRHFRH
ncbi:MAG TPA: bifunctional phosphoribosylaminoimidazolecarboxamide formyltransferase/inosine monophosphate cyclohydrolase [Clostridiales bacterium]|nr:bifunctional phosphoribosylaminoimidazolecarboxamide formyltransferase/inosine monophosphate cyclohydrolase [Clostridiales bacterium]